MKPLGAIIGFLGCVLLWALAEALSELLGDAATATVAPAWRPVWRVFLRARWPWPAILMAALGVTGVIAGFRLNARYEPGWRGVAAFVLYVVGGAVAAATPFLWRDARRARARDAAQAPTNRHPDPLPNVRWAVGALRKLNVTGIRQYAPPFPCPSRPSDPGRLWQPNLGV